ncbi:hypothetical protein COV19_00815 [Candidatus Woesearchaeota archaeon CG10_big_fil_rev_8_21_14_0_10_44_13]|nr:MAG: hypothetical protein COV19_00815 [Candidatus Woesearchaeota archaeon CG10_big_fil_rev_8_21_14_0_10_44_13]
MVNIEKELEENQTILLLMMGENYNNLTLSIAKQLSGKKMCYVTLNKTFHALDETFSKNGIDTKNMVFVDTISRTFMDKPEQTGRCHFISSPAALTELSITLSKFVKDGFDYIIFDSLTNLMVYEKKAPVAKFLSSVINRVKEGKIKAVFYALKVDQHNELIQECSMFVDKVIDLGR